MNELQEKLDRIERYLIIMSKEVFSAKEAAMFMGKSLDRIRKLTSERQLPHYKNGATVYYKKSELEKWMLQQRIPTADEVNDIANKYILTH